MEAATNATAAAAQASTALTQSPCYDTFHKCWESAHTLHHAICFLWTDMTACKNPDPRRWARDKNAGSSVLHSLADVLQSMVDVMSPKLPRRSRALCIATAVTPVPLSTGWPIDCDEDHPITARCISLGTKMSAIESAMLEKRDDKDIFVDLRQLCRLVDTVKQEWDATEPPPLISPSPVWDEHDDCNFARQQVADWENESPPTSEFGEDHEPNMRPSPMVQRWLRGKYW